MVSWSIDDSDNSTRGVEQEKLTQILRPEHVTCRAVRDNIDNLGGDDAKVTDVAQAHDALQFNGAGRATVGRRLRGKAGPPHSRRDAKHQRSCLDRPLP